jgi:enediyne biosynthesis protein E4
MPYDRMIIRRAPSMGYRRLFCLLGSVGLAALSGCGDDTGTGAAGAGPVGGGGGAGGGAVEVCDAHAVQGVTTFSDTTDAWGLVGVAGGRVMSGDVNGDGYADLLVHGFAPNTRETVGGAKLTYLLINEAAGDGRVFVDRTYESGFAVPADGSTTELKASHLAVLADVDNDGDLDIFSGTYSELPAAIPATEADLDRSEMYLNDGAGNFTRLADSGVAFEDPRRTSGGTFTDVNRDGVIDLFVGVHYSATGVMQAPALYLGNGDGTFEDVTKEWNVDSEKRATFAVTSCDLDDDGSPELLMSAYARGPDVLYTYDGAEFNDVGEDAGTAFDENRDYTDNQNFLCWCTVNDGDGACDSAAEPQVQCPTPAGAAWAASETKDPRLGGNTFTTVCHDIDGDGKLDLYNAEIAHWWAGQSSDKSNVLYNKTESPGQLAFSHADRAEMGLEVPHVGVDWNEGGIVALAADLDGDARSDIYLGASDYPDQFGWLFRQKEDKSFEEVGEAVGFHHPCAVGVTAADFDRDGDLDVVVASGTARDCAEIWDTNEIHIYENGGEAKSNWLAIRLAGDGTTANAAAIGARVKVTAGEVTQVQELQSGYGHFGLQNDTSLFFALGDCNAAATVEIVWPDQARSSSVFEAVTGGRMIELRQGDDTVHDVLPAL